MEKGTKIALIVGSAVAVAGGGIGLCMFLKNRNQGGEPRKEKKEEDNANNPNKDVKNQELLIGKEVVSEIPVNLRFENYVDNAMPTNIIKSGFKGTIGTLEKVEKANKEEAPDDLYDWYYVKLYTPINVSWYDATTRASSGEHTHCWVRSDNVKIK